MFKGRDKFDSLVAKAKAENWKALPIGERTAAVGQALVGTRYKSFTLEIDNRIEAPSVNFTGLDCWTFYEVSLAFARMLNEPGGEAGRRSRCCITSSWTDIAAGNAQANICRASIISKTGWRITIAADWWKI